MQVWLSRRFASSSASAAARYLADCRLAARQIKVLDSFHDLNEGASWPDTMAAAYDAQRELHGILAQHGHHVVGHKVGCTTPVMQRYLSVPHPCSGAILSSGLWRSEPDVPLQLDCSRHVRLGLECELAVVLAAPLPPGGGLPEAARAVESVHAAVELVDDRYEDFEARRPGMLAWVADDFFHAGSALGPALEADPLSLDSLHGAMWVDGALAGSGVGADIISGHPLNALVWLANSQAAHAMGGLPAGWVVSLGSVCRTHWVQRKPSTKVRVTFGREAFGTEAAPLAGHFEASSPPAALDLELLCADHGPD